MLEKIDKFLDKVNNFLYGIVGCIAIVAIVLYVILKVSGK